MHMGAKLIRDEIALVKFFFFFLLSQKILFIYLFFHLFLLVGG